MYIYVYIYVLDQTSVSTSVWSRSVWCSGRRRRKWAPKMRVLKPVYMKCLVNKKVYVVCIIHLGLAQINIP